MLPYCTLTLQPLDVVPMNNSWIWLAKGLFEHNIPLLNLSDGCAPLGVGSVFKPPPDKVDVIFLLSFRAQKGY